MSTSSQEQMSQERKVTIMPHSERRHLRRNVIPNRAFFVDAGVNTSHSVNMSPLCSARKEELFGSWMHPEPDH